MDQLYKLPDEYEALRETVRALADKKIAPYAHDVDANARFPQEAPDAEFLVAKLVQAPDRAPHPGDVGCSARGALPLWQQQAKVFPVNVRRKFTRSAGDLHLASGRVA